MTKSVSSQIKSERDAQAQKGLRRVRNSQRRGVRNAIANLNKVLASASQFPILQELASSNALMDSTVDFKALWQEYLIDEEAQR